jgi:LPXTG-motif cell wall-anchored protein
MVEDVPLLLPIGAVCTVTETDSGGADAVPAPVTVTIVKNAQNDTVQATFTNEFSAGTVALSKVLAGAGATASYATGATFTVLVTCAKGSAANVLHSQPVEIKGGERIELEDANGDPVLLPLGTKCWTVEQKTGGATSNASNADSFATGLEVVGGDPQTLQELELEVTNTFDLTSVSLLKQVDGAAAGYAAGRQFTIAVTCVLPQDGTLTPLVTAKPFTLTAGQTATVSDLPVGAQCWAQETDTGGATSTVVSHPGQAQALTAAATGSNQLTVTNTFAAAELTVSKKVVDGPAGPYAFEVACTTAQGPVTLAAGDASFGLRHGDEKTISVPLGAECDVEEVDVPNAAEVSYDDSTAAGGGKHDGHVVVAPAASVTVTNTFDPGTGDAGAGDGDGGVGDNSGGVGDNSGGVLPDTGGAAGWLLALGLLLLLVGGAWHLRNRRTA